MPRFNPPTLFLLSITSSSESADSLSPIFKTDVPSAFFPKEEKKSDSILKGDFSCAFSPSAAKAGMLARTRRNITNIAVILLITPSFCNKYDFSNYTPQADKPQEKNKKAGVFAPAFIIINLPIMLFY
jgi:hypothetical protein